MNETKERILDTAERLFAAHGHAATSLRSIIAEAGVNVAAVHYHFRSKEALLDAVLERRLGPVNRERLALLDDIERAAGEEPLPLEHILTALLEPPLRLAQDPVFVTFSKLMGRILGDSNGEIMRKHFGEIIERFSRALRRAIPELPQEELQWRAYFCLAILAHTLTGPREILGISGPPTVERLVTFISAGFRAPVPEMARSSR
jgi:AcrR family transcriptional regulator